MLLEIQIIDYLFTLQDSLFSWQIIELVHRRNKSIAWRKTIYLQFLLEMSMELV